MLGKKIVYIFLFFALLFSIVYTKNADYNEDLGRHLALGKIIIQTHSIPKTNLFSYTNTNFPFNNHHWLSEVVFYVVHAKGGDTALAFMKITIVASALLLIGYLSVRSSNEVTLVFATSLVAVPLWLRTTVRPEIFGYLFFALTLWIVFFKRNSWKVILFLLPINILWVNIHITFVFGMCIQALLLITKLYEYFILSKKNKTVLAVLIVAMSGVIINPHWLSGALYPLTIFNNYGYTIAENQGIRFMINYTSWIYYRYVYWLLLIGFAGAMYLLAQRNYLASAIFVIFTSLACFQIRHVPFFALSFIFFMPQVMYDIGTSVVSRFSLSKASFSFALFTGILSVGFLLILVSNTYSRVYLQAISFGIGQRNQYASAVSFVQKEKLHARIFNNFDIGGYLIYALYPQYKVFVDNRPEAYPADFFNLYKKVQTDPATRRKIFEKFDIHTILFAHTDQTEWARAFMDDMFADNAWKLVYLDPYVFIMTDKPARDIRAGDDTRLFERLVAQTSNPMEVVSYYSLFTSIGNRSAQQDAMEKLTRVAPGSCTVIKGEYYKYAQKNNSYYSQIAQKLRSAHWYCF